MSAKLLSRGAGGKTHGLIALGQRSDKARSFVNILMGRHPFSPLLPPVNEPAAVAETASSEAPIEELAADSPLLARPTARGTRRRAATGGPGGPGGI